MGYHHSQEYDVKKEWGQDFSSSNCSKDLDLPFQSLYSTSFLQSLISVSPY